MFNKRNIALFFILFVPMLIVSALLNFLYTLNSNDYTQINWFIVILLAIALDVFILWMQTWKYEENKSE